MRISPTKDKIDKTRYRVSQMLHTPLVKIQSLAEVIGILVSNFPGVQYGPLHYRSLEKDKISALKKSHGNFDSTLALSPSSRSELIWWYDNISNAYCKIVQDEASHILICDASMSGWGALLGDKKVNGFWNDCQKSCHINYLELLAVQYALTSFCDTFSFTHVHVLSDSVTAVTYLNHMGGIKSNSCNDLVQSIWQWCINRNIWISASHIPGTENTEADLLSRDPTGNTECMLNPTIFRTIVSLWGQPEIDLFASRINCQLHKYVSWQSHPSAFATNALSISWKNVFFYAFPPFSLIGKCLRKIEMDQASGILVAPQWTTQTWYTRIMQLLVDQPILLRPHKDLLTLPFSKTNTHPLHKKLRLMVCRVSGKLCESDKFRQGLQKSYFPLGDQALESNTPALFTNGSFSVVKGVSIPFVLLST
ncbi:hypothetical protein HOLleu_12330 [Holothuria leucospilota]|uniref:Uncharacterized protein n=2 Tax=Holothuria leucospilota TaxID=206669 RepID=A0A9Q1CB80_HOLLE|nr:hypothetical protein HOLleu_12330 [Holothuria leucospilota]